MANTGSISGQLINIYNNQPLSGATVKIGGPSNESTTTDDDGRFKVANLAPANDYSMDISASGFDTEHYEDIVVIADIDTDLNRLGLRPSYN